MVDPNFLTGDPGFAQHLLHYTNYDVAVAYIKTAILNDRTKKSWFIKSIGREIERKKEDVLAKIVEYKKEFAVKNDTFERKVETIFCARLIPDELGLLYCCTVGTRDNSVF